MAYFRLRGGCVLVVRARWRHLLLTDRPPANTIIIDIGRSLMGGDAQPPVDQTYCTFSVHLQLEFNAILVGEALHRLGKLESEGGCEA